ncbi:MAG: ATP-binding protein, partial [Eubacteriales bacterium]|nr:ATP-binding protein [Eubacteriales bacterium]
FGTLSPLKLGRSIMYIPRAIEASIQKLVATFPVLLITGPRQVGKSTLLTHMATPDRKIVTLDDPDIRLLAKMDPALFLQRFSPPVLIDEIQYATELLPYIKMSVDRSQRNGDFWLTGSQSFVMMKNVSETLAGRVGIINLLGLSTREIKGLPSRVFTTDANQLMDRLPNAPKQDINDLFSRIFKGSMPRLYANEAVDWETYYRSYVDTYLKRDIKDLTQVADEMSFFQFMTVVAARTAKPIVYEEIASETGISAPTAKKWLSLLVSSHIIALIQPYQNNVLKRVTKMPLMHFLDTGLCAYLLKWGNSEALEKGAMSGAFFESYVFSEIYKSYLNAGKEPPLYYYRDKDKKEIDLLIYENGTLFPIEIKKSASPNRDATKHFHVLDPVETPERFGELARTKTLIGPGAVICMALDLLPIDGKNWIVPAWLI